MIVADGHGRRLPARPDKADTVAVIDADAVLAPAVAPQRFQPIARRLRQVIQRDGRVKGFQLFRGDGMEFRRASTPGGGVVHAVENIRSPPVGKIRNHSAILALRLGDGKQLTILFSGRRFIPQRCSE